MKYRSFGLLSFLMAGLWFSASAAIAGTEEIPKGTGPCADDVKKFCGGVAPGGGAIHECMVKNESQLSAACKTQMGEMMNRMKAMKEKFQEARSACEADVEKFCKDIPAGQGGRMRCLRENAGKPDFSPGCKAQWDKMKALKSSQKDGK